MIHQGFPGIYLNKPAQVVQHGVRGSHNNIRPTHALAAKPAAKPKRHLVFEGMQWEKHLQIGFGEIEGDTNQQDLSNRAPPHPEVRGGK
jgi:hypothetical protein